MGLPAQELAKDLPIALRPYDPAGDESFVFSTWLKSCWQIRKTECQLVGEGKLALIRQGAYTAFIPHDIYYREYRKFVEKVMSVSQVTVACMKDDPSQVLGYMVHRMLGDVPVISFAYVKQPYRGMGIAKLMASQFIGNETAIITHIQPWLSQNFKKHRLIYNPFIDLKLLGET